ncbi:hypothetical protein [Falsiroseomonas sp. CW058]|uniref:hypothetical protein n=1 Tax=Falsiroseomonas sp. CW058 TaxID=3388664 RepID=UPI003D315F35
MASRTTIHAVDLRPAGHPAAHGRERAALPPASARGEGDRAARGILLALGLSAVAWAGLGLLVAAFR